MIDRYTLPEMAAVWSEERKLERWQEVEALALEGWEAAGVVPQGAAAAVRSAGPIDAAAWKDREAVIHHDLAAFVDVLAERMPEHRAWLHYGLTSSDVLDTALGATLKEAAELLEQKVRHLFDVVRGRSLEHRDTVMVGRTHGIWAEPTTFGLKLAGWAFEVIRSHRRLQRGGAAVSYGKLSGAVGTYAHVLPEVERHVCDALGLNAEPAATQIVARDRHAEFLTAAAILGGTLDRMATEIRHLSRSEVAEVAESFGSDQKGSSAMPHKRNPIRSENVTGLARLLRGWAVAGLENVPLWHERDISHSSVERVILPDACLVLDFALTRIATVIEHLDVDADRMWSNLEGARGLVFSQAVMLRLIDSGMDRDASYRLVQEHATRLSDGTGTLHDSLAADPDVPLDAATLAGCFDPAGQLARSSGVFDLLERATLDLSPRPVRTNRIG
jgi:adenylosuccinate lyase